MPFAINAFLRALWSRIRPPNSPSWKMATRYPSRHRDPVRRFGFDSVDLDISDEEREEDLDENVHLPTSDSFTNLQAGTKRSHLATVGISFNPIVTLLQI